MSLESRLLIRTRPAGHGDLNECLQLLPSWLPLDESARKSIPLIWTRLLSQPAFNADVIENLNQPAGKAIVGVGMSIALDEHWSKRLTDDPPPFAAAHVYRALMDGSFTPPTDKELGIMNAAGNVTFLVLHYTQKLHDFRDPDTINLLSVAMTMFRNSHSGYRLKQLYQEGVGSELEYLASMGFRSRTQRAARPLLRQEDSGVPELYGLSREEAAQLLPGNPVRDAFQFTPPVLGLSASERRMLRLAIHDQADEAVSHELDLSGHTIKKLWASIHNRVAMKLPSLYNDMATGMQKDMSTRGPEKRRCLINYLRHHPEELRPFRL